MVNPNGNNTRLRTEYSHRYAGTPTYTIAPKLEFKGETLEATLRGSYSRSEFNFRDNSEGFFQRTDNWLTGIGFTMDRPNEGSNAWNLNQTAGRPWVIRPASTATPTSATTSVPPNPMQSTTSTAPIWI